MGKYLCKSHKDAAKVVKNIEIYKCYNQKVFFFLRSVYRLAAYPIIILSNVFTFARSYVVCILI
jgi:hypothetical protein